VTSDKAARAAALRVQLQAVAPEMLAFMDQMKEGFDAKVVYVEAPGIKEGKEPEPGLIPHVPLPDSTWGYEPGQSPNRPKRKR